jgi:hypothetical protein
MTLTQNLLLATVLIFYLKLLEKSINNKCQNDLCTPMFRLKFSCAKAILQKYCQPKATFPCKLVSLMSH